VDDNFRAIPALPIDRNLDSCGCQKTKLPEGGGGTVAQNGAIDRKFRSNPTAFVRMRPVADRIDTAVHAMQTTDFQSVADRAPPQTNGCELGPRHHAPLPAGERSDHSIDRFEVTFGPYFGLKVSPVGHARTLPDGRARRTHRTCRIAPGSGTSRSKAGLGALSTLAQSPPLGHTSSQRTTRRG
jgi:hypothetical protein